MCNEISSDQITFDQITLLRRLTCYLACFPNRHTPANLAQALRQLADGMNLDAVGVYWLVNGQLQPLAHWPPQFTPPPVGDGDGATIDSPVVIPMHCDGKPLGQLWFVVSRLLTPAEQDFITLVANQLALVWQNNQLYSQLAALTERRGQLLRRLIQADEQCSRRVSRELHDEISQSLTALLFDIDTILATHLHHPHLLETHLTHLRHQLGQVTDEVNRIVLDLRPTLLENNGLVAALGWYGTERLRPVGVKLHLSSGQCIPHLSDCATTMLYRIVQEALTNVARHAQAKNVWLNITCQADLLLMSIRDDGQGFNPNQYLHPDGLRGVGLLGMQERAALLNAEFSIDSRPGEGTHIQLHIPLEEVHREANQDIAGRRPCGSS